MQKFLIIFEIVIILGSLFSDDFWASFFAGNVVLEIPLLIPYIIFRFIKNKKTQNNKNAEIEKEIDKILQKSKQDGSLGDIENLKNLVEQNIKTNGSSIEFLELNFAIAKLYNIRVETEKAKEYFNKVKNILSRLNYQDICFLAKKSTDEKDFHDAVFFYTYILLYNKVKDIKEIPEIYYNRAIAYQGLNQVSYKDKAIDDLKTAITKTNEISDSLSYIEVEAFLEGKVDKYNFKIGEIYQDLKEYDKAIKYYNQVSKKNSFKCNSCGKIYKFKMNNCSCGNKSFSTLHNEYSIEAHEKIQECSKLTQEKEELLKKQKEEEIKRKKKFDIKRAESIYNRALKEYKEHQYEKAKKSIENAINLADNQIYRDLLKDIDYKILHNDDSLIKNNEPEYITSNDSKQYSARKVNLETCNKNDLLTIDGFDKEKADRFIKERNNGKIYYDIETFVADFALMPHQMIDIQDRLVFPPKPKNKIGRKIDW